MRHVACALALLPAVARAQAIHDGARRDTLSAMLRSVTATQVAGSAVGLVAKGGRITFLEASGSVGGGPSMPVDAIVRLASLTKPVTAAAVLMLVEDGKHRLSDPVDRWFPGFGRDVATPTGETVRAERRVTIRDLLTHASGIATLGRAVDSAYDAGSADGFAQRIATAPLRFQPGSRFDYGCCGSSYDVLGAIVERVTGRSLAEEFRTRIFEPLGLSDTFFRVSDEKRARLAAQYRPDAVGRLVEARARGQEDTDSAFLSGAGGLRSTATDFFRFAQFLLNEGELNGVRLLKKSTVQQMTGNQVGTHYPPKRTGGATACARRVHRGSLAAVMVRSISDDAMPPESPMNVPSVAISAAARRNPVQAARASAPPTLMRRTPASASALTVA